MQNPEIILVHQAMLDHSNSLVEKKTKSIQIQKKIKNHLRITMHEIL